MRGLIRASLMNPWAVTVFAMTIVVLGCLSLFRIPIDILPAYGTPAVQVLTFYGGMPPSEVQSGITHRMERWTGMAPGIARQEARSILGASIVRNYFHPGTQRAEAIASEISLAQAEIPNLPPGTLPPIVMAFDPSATTPVCLVALNSKSADEATLYDVGRYEVRSKVMQIQGAVSPVVFGGKIRAVQVYLDRAKMQARRVAPLDVMNAVADSNVFLPTGEAIVGDMDYFLNSNAMFERRRGHGRDPAADRARQPRLRRRRGRPAGRGADPDDHRPRRGPQAGLHPGDAVDGRQHPPRRQHAEGPDRLDPVAADPRAGSSWK